MILSRENRVTPLGFAIGIAVLIAAIVLTRDQPPLHMYAAGTAVVGVILGVRSTQLDKQGRLRLRDGGRVVAVLHIMEAVTTFLAAQQKEALPPLIRSSVTVAAGVGFILYMSAEIWQHWRTRSTVSQ